VRDRLLLLAMFVALSLCVIHITIMRSHVKKLQAQVSKLEQLDNASTDLFKSIDSVFKTQANINDKLTEEVVLLNLKVRQLEREDTSPLIKKRREEAINYHQSDS